MTVVTACGHRPRSGNVSDSFDAVGVVTEQTDEDQFWKSRFSVPTEPLFKFLFSEVDSVSVRAKHSWSPQRRPEPNAPAPLQAHEK